MAVRSVGSGIAKESRFSFRSVTTEGVTKIKALQTAVLQHAKNDEESRFYPQLKQKLDAKQNALLTSKYRAQFDSVNPVPVV